VESKDPEPIGEAIIRNVGERSQLMERGRPFCGLQLKVEVVRKMIGRLARMALTGKRGKSIESQIFASKNPPHTFDE
jgi:hypothetical protein